MKIVVDAMGGDHAPEAVVEGAVMAAREYNTEIILTGLSDTIQAILDRLDPVHKLTVQVVHAYEVVEMHDLPGRVLRSKRKSSMKIGLDLLKEGKASAFVSAGNTGAVLAYSTVILRPLKGVDRPAIAIQLPTLKGNAILLDAGANVDCKTSQLFQFGIMGHVFAEYIRDYIPIGLRGLMIAGVLSAAMSSLSSSINSLASSTVIDIYNIFKEN